MASITEIILFDANDAFREDPNLFAPAFDIAAQADGAQFPAYYGTQVENGTTGYLFLNWDSYEAHQVFIKAPYYPDVIAKLVLGLKEGSKPDMLHVAFSDSPNAAFGKPVTEVDILTLKAPENRAAVVEILTSLSELSDKVFVFGQTHEDENKYVLINGWETVEAQSTANKKPEVAAALDKLHSLAVENHRANTKLLHYPS